MSSYLSEQFCRSLLLPKFHTKLISGKKNKKKVRLDIKRENLPFVTPYVWVKQKKGERTEFEASGTDKLFKERFMFISEELHIPSLLNDTATILKRFTKSTGVVTYLVDSSINQIYVCPPFNDHSDETNRVAWNIRTGSTIPAYVAFTKETVLVNNMTKEEKFQAYDWKDRTVTGELCVPIVNSDGSCYGVIELYRRNGDKYVQPDVKKIMPVIQMISVAIDNHLNRINLQMEQMLLNYLLDMTQYYFTNPNELHKLVRDIVNLAKVTLNSERGSYFSHDLTSNTLLIDLYSHYSDMLSNLIHRHKLKIQAQKERGIARLALRTGRLINIRDAYNDPRYDRASARKTGLITRSILCIPVFCHNIILGVLQLINKQRGYYTVSDEEKFRLFAKFCSIGLHHKHSHEMRILAQNWKDVYCESFFSQIMNINTKPQYDIQNIVLPSGFYRYSFYETKEDDLTKYAFWIFKSLHIPPENCKDFVFSVRRGYRDNPYHNFEHAVNVLHTAACFIKEDPNKFEYLEKVGFFISAICHDIDHGGLSNYFQEIVESAFVVLYEESPLENHHLFMTLIILNQSTLKDVFSKEDFKEILNYIREMILATDLTLHLQERAKLRALCEQIESCGPSIWTEDIENRRSVRNLLMTAADLSGMAKPFNVTKVLVKNLMKELFIEGEKIKKLGRTPLPLLDIKYIDKIPEQQIQFLDIVCIPCFRILQVVLPQTIELQQLSEKLRATWVELIKFRDSQK